MKPDPTHPNTPDFQVRLGPEPIDPANTGTRTLTHTGAVLEFSGVVRDAEQARPIAALFYEAYEPMARRSIAGLIRETASRFPVQFVLIRHRTGWVAVGQTSLYIRVESTHRAEAFAFCAAFIDRLKEDVPIWKSDYR